MTCIFWVRNSLVIDLPTQRKEQNEAGNVQVTVSGSELFHFMSICCVISGIGNTRILEVYRFLRRQHSCGYPQNKLLLTIFPSIWCYTTYSNEWSKSRPFFLTPFSFISFSFFLIRHLIGQSDADQLNFSSHLRFKQMSN